MILEIENPFHTKKGEYMKEAIILWNDLEFYIWCKLWKRANNVCKKINEVKKNSPLKYYVSYILSRFIIL